MKSIAEAKDEAFSKIVNWRWDEKSDADVKTLRGILGELSQISCSHGAIGTLTKISESVEHGFNRLRKVKGL